MLNEIENLDIIEAAVGDVIVENGRLQGLSQMGLNIALVRPF